MTHLLWKSYWEDDVDKFRRLLSPAGNGAHNAARSSNIGAAGSPGHGTPPRLTPKLRKTQGHGHASLGRSDVNSRDHAGLTILLRAASSAAENAVSFVEALLEHPAIDIYAQDPESGWNALHRALYAGNISIARMLLEKERADLAGHMVSVSRVGELIKTKDHEGNSPFDLYNSTIGERNLKDWNAAEVADDGSDSDDSDHLIESVTNTGHRNGVGEDLYAFGSNRNRSLGFGDEDDRQYPERVFLKRPDHLLQRFYNEYLEEIGAQRPASQDLAKIPALVLNRPLTIQDVVLSKLHSAVLTTDPVSNLYICGVGRGGRLGLGDENTRFTYVPVQGPFVDRRVVQAALGQNHTMAVDDTGALWTWGSNAHSQLGYALPTPARKDEEPISTVPRQVFGSLKKEVILGVAASSIHSVAHTGASLFCWGKNLGQLALMDADSRSLEFQQTPRKVGASLFSSPIVMVSAIDKATTILLQNHTVCVFTGYGYHIVKFPFASFDYIGNLRLSNRHEVGWNQIDYITSGGETIAALTKRGDLFTMNLDHKIETNPAATSTTNPSKLKGAVTQPQRIWNASKDGVCSVGVGENGSVIFSTQSGAVWRRIKRVKAKDASNNNSESKRKDFKFQRVPYITKVATVRASAYGAFAAIREDSEVMKQQLGVDEPTLWDDVAPLNSLEGFEASEDQKLTPESRKFWENPDLKARLGDIVYEVLKSPDLESDLARHLTTWGYQNELLDTCLCVSTCPEIKIPVHSWLLSARSSVLRRALSEFRVTGDYTHELLTIQNDDSKAVICLQGSDLLTLLNLVLFAYQDRVIPVWNFTRHAPALAYRYRQVRLEVMRLATRLEMHSLEAATRLQVEPKRCMDEDFRSALKDRRRFFEDGDALLELDKSEVPVHSKFLCQRCPWFEGLFHGRSAGAWLAGRRAEQDRIRLDMKHMDSTAFGYVLQYLYGDTGDELFDPAVCDTFDDFLDLVMDVMSIANYLMLDRLSQICQKVMGRFVNIRNIAHFLNAIGPCSVTEFKDAGLEYICLQLETMLENHLLDELDEDILLELDAVVRDNQLAHFPYLASYRGQLSSQLDDSSLAEDILEERQVRVKEMAYKGQKEEESRKMSAAVRTKFGSLEEAGPFTPTPDRVRRMSKIDRHEPFSPDLHARASQGDLMFDMEDDESAPLDSPSLRARKPVEGAAGLEKIPPLGSSIKGKGKKVWMSLDQSPPTSSFSATTPTKPPLTTRTPDVGTPGKQGTPWGGAATISTSKLDLRDIIQSESPQSALSAGLLAAQNAKDALPRLAQPKMSQKERKRQQQAAQNAQVTLLASEAGQPKNAWETAKSETNVAPWKLATIKGRGAPKPTVSSAQHATQGLLSPDQKPRPIRSASPDTRFSGQRPTPAASSSAPKPPVPVSVPTAKPAESLVPHSKNYITPAHKLERDMSGFTMEDIIQQEIRDKESVKEAMAKRSLQEIQQEQEFQEWWDAESKRMQEEEDRRLAREVAGVERVGKREGNKRGRGGKGRGGGGGGGSSGDADASKMQEKGNHQRGAGRKRGQRGGGQGSGSGNGSRETQGQGQGQGSGRGEKGGGGPSSNNTARGGSGSQAAGRGGRGRAGGRREHPSTAAAPAVVARFGTGGGGHVADCWVATIMGRKDNPEVECDVVG
ncbi:hypothetical protein QBC40DRAFT_347764 [Triangularia verruculosa]|uniref:BTB domain-containing protein n=1 Tax=Triangularia verruculosa TaxID=2587418 RepID=A0AAN6XN76_9PEZI|nr:hypothetical protein QBC40DRAFT_347764 [Triangularia verruculosa]